MARVLVRHTVFRWLSALLVGVALLAAVSGAVELLDQHVPVLSLFVLFVLALLPVALVWGAGVGVVAALVSAAVFGALFLAPVHPRILEPQILFPLAVFLLTVAVVGELAVRSRQRARESARLTEEQAALRRVATLVARGTPPPEVFDAVIREVAVLSRADLARLERFEPDGTVTGVAVWSKVPAQLAVGTRLTLEGLSIAKQVQESGCPARVDSFVQAPGVIAREARELGIRSSVGCPILVGGRIWGVIAASSKSETPFPPNTEAQIGEFTELVATAIANAQSRTEITGLLGDQAALRRVATLVARGTPTAEIISAAADEVGSVLGALGTIVVRLDPDGLATVIARTGSHPERVPVGSRWKLEPPVVMGEAIASGRPARRDDYQQVPGAFADAVRGIGVRAAIAIPIAVGGRLWGALGVGTREKRFPDDAEQRLAAFTELVAIAVADAESAAQLAASRARVVAAADEARRRIERDLHDGAQQRLVTLGLELRLVEESVPTHLSELRSGIARIADELADVLDELREMSRGIHPAVLSDGGLEPALQSLVRRSSTPVALDVRAQSRFPESVEVAAYYVVSEALTNIAKHADASSVTIDLEEHGGTVLLTVQDDGVGGAGSVGGSGLVGIRDRVEALGGTFEVDSPVGEGTLVKVALPLRSG